MVQVRVLNGRQAGAEHVARRFPFRVGRSVKNDLCAEEPGVWERHLEITWLPPSGFSVSPSPNTAITVNEQPSGTTRLRNGDVIGLGSLKLMFTLSPTRARGVRLREWVTWGGFALLCLGQVALIYWLPG